MIMWSSLRHRMRSVLSFCFKLMGKKGRKMFASGCLLVSVYILLPLCRCHHVHHIFLGFYVFFSISHHNMVVENHHHHPNMWVPTHKCALYFAVLIMVTLKDKEAVKIKTLLGSQQKSHNFLLFFFHHFSWFCFNLWARGINMVKWFQHNLGVMVHWYSPFWDPRDPSEYVHPGFKSNGVQVEAPAFGSLAI
jgi:hypothetical protein